MPPSSLIIKILYFINGLHELCFVSFQKMRQASPPRLYRRRLFQMSSPWGGVCVCSWMCLMFVLHQLRQVSQAKRWDDVGTGRRTIRQSRVIESLDFPDEEFGVNLGIVSVWGRAASDSHTVNVTMLVTEKPVLLVTPQIVLELLLYMIIY